MSSSKEFLPYIFEQMEGLGSVWLRKMFGEYMIYLNDESVVQAEEVAPLLQKRK